jgi:hypothetical protein
VLPEAGGDMGISSLSLPLSLPHLRILVSLIISSLSYSDGWEVGGVERPALRSPPAVGGGGCGHLMGWVSEPWD